MATAKPLSADTARRLRLVRNKYKDVDFPYDDIIWDESYEEEYMETVADVIRLSTWWGAFAMVMDEEPDKAQKIFREYQEKMMKLLELEGNPEEILVKIKYSYALVMCRKPLQQ